MHEKASNRTSVSENSFATIYGPPKEPVKEIAQRGLTEMKTPI